MPRVLHHRVLGLPAERLERLEHQYEALGSARQWRTGPPWIASDRSSDLFHTEYFRHLREDEGTAVSAGGFLKMLIGDETDALILAVFLRDVSAEYGVRTVLKDEENPIAKLRHLEFRRGRMPSGNALEEMLARRPLVKKVLGHAITFYPPSYRAHSHLQTATITHWGYAVCGLRANAPSLLEAEQEALKILRGMRHLGR